MMTIDWRKNIREASEEISGGTRLVLLFFHHPDCEGSQKTINETLKDEKVVAAIEREFAPVSINTALAKDLEEKYRIDWTPAFVVADERGVELERWVGYLPAEDFIAQMTLSKGLAAFHLSRYDECERELAMLVEEHPRSELVPEAEYFLGASIMKQQGDAYRLGEICQTLKDKYPESMWTKRCEIWSYLVTESRKPFVGYDVGGTLGSGAY